MQIWKEVEEYLTAVLINPTITSNISTSAAILQSSGSRTALTEQDEEEESMDDDHCIVMTTLLQIVQDKHNLADIEQQVVSEQKINH